MFNTTYEEAVGFSVLKGSFEYLLFIPYLVILYMAFRYPPKSKYRIGKLHYTIGGAFLFLIFSFFTENTMHDRFVRKSTPILVQTISSFNKEIKSFRQLKRELNLQTLQLKATPLLSKNPQVKCLS